MKCKYTLLLVVFIGINAFSQNNNPLDRQYQPPTTSFFGNPVLSKSPYSNKKIKEDKSELISQRKKNVLSFSVTDLVRSNFRFTYERQLAPSFCITLGGGFAFGNDPFEQVLGSYFFASSFADSQTERFITHLYADSKRTSGYHVSASLRTYFSYEEKSALFWEVNWRMMNNTNEILQSHNDRYKPNSMTFNTSIHHFALMFGSSYSPNTGKRIVVHELSCGFGFKQSIWDKYVPISQPQSDPSYAPVIWYEKQSSMTSAVKTPLFLIRYQLGMGW